MSQALRSTTVSGAHHRSFCNGRPAASRRIVAVRCDAVAASKQVETRQLGKSGLTVPVMGVGAWSWGDRSGYWSRTGANWGYEESKEAYQALMDAGINFIDTAEVYGFGKSEEFIGDFIRQRGGPAPIIATKYAPQPWRQTSGSVVSACKASLKRLGQQKMGLYIQHWPGFLLNAWSNDGILEGLAECYNSGLTEAVGVSNFTAKRVNNAAKVLQERGTCLSSNQVQYSLLYRRPETTGVMEACKENGVTMVAYSPMCQGLLTGKYTPDGPKPKGPRGAVYSSKIKEIESLISGMRAIGEPRGKTPAQVALNWVICQGALPIPGAKNARQVQEVAGAVGWRLDEGEMAELDKLSSRIPPATGAPFEKCEAHPALPSRHPRQPRTRQVDYAKA